VRWRSRRAAALDPGVQVRELEQQARPLLAVGDRPAAHQVVDALALAGEVHGGVMDADPGLGNDGRAAKPLGRPFHEEVDHDRRQQDRDVIHRHITARGNLLPGEVLFALLFAPHPNAPHPAGPGTRESPANTQLSGDGESRTRTGDTTIFSRVLYQLS
jgi:hypothetical protein